MMVVWLDEVLVTSTAESAMTTMAVVHLSSPGQARMLLLWQSSSG
jgi:hypothetical protein